MCPYASCSDCCIGHSNGTLVGPNLVGGGGGCSCMLLHPAPTCPGAVLTFALCTGGDFLQSTGADTPLVHVVVSTCCNLRWWCFSIHQLTQILHLYTRWSSPVTLQLVLVMFFLPATGANTLLALCVGGCMWWCQYVVVVVVAIYVVVAV